jgi:dTDP-4-dehydrorhamnose reductase
MNILVTGANGQLGSEFRKISEDSINKYLFTDVAELDITSKNAIMSFVTVNKVDIIINCAAYTNVDKAEDDQATAILINETAVGYLAEVCKEKNVILVHISSDYVFKGDKNTPCCENEPTDPLGFYGQTKLNGELNIQRVGCKYLIFRTAWLYSQYGNNFVKTMLRLTKEKDKLNVVFDQVGTPTYAEDLAILIGKIIEKEDFKNNYGIYHFSNEGVCSWFDFSKEIASLVGNECDIQPCHSDEFPSKVQRPHFSVLDKTKVKKTFDVKIPYWKESLKKCLRELN